MADYYKTLGVARNATDAEIKKAFRDLAKKHHPDVNKGDAAAEGKFKEINEAYAVLSDKQKRQQYDTYGAEGFSQRFSQEDIFRGFDFNGVFSDIFGGGGGGFGDDILSSIFGGGGRKRGRGRGPRVHFTGGPQGFGGGGPQGFGGGGPQGFGGGGPQGFGGFDFGGGGRGGPPPRGDNYEAEITLPLDFAHSGGKRRVSLQTADGRPLEVEVTVPKGIRSGKKLKLTGKGGPGPGGAPPGDLFLKVVVAKHPQFKADGDDVIVEKEAPITALALGGEIEVPTLDGPSRTLKIKAGTANNARIRIRGHGLHTANGARGDQFVVIRGTLPEDLSDEQKELFEKLRELGV